MPRCLHFFSIPPVYSGGSRQLAVHGKAWPYLSADHCTDRALCCRTLGTSYQDKVKKALLFGVGNA